MERKIECALDPDRFISYNNCISFVRNLEGVESEIAKLITSEPTRAASLYEAFLACCKRILLLGGRAWHVKHVNWQRRTAYVEPSEDR